MFDILIADDEKKWRELAKETFLIAGYSCDFATNVQQAIKKLETEKYRLVCINWKLEDYHNGRALLQRLNSEYAEIPVILTTGYPARKAGVWEDLNQDIEALRTRYPNLVKIINKGESENGSDFVDILLEETQNWISDKQNETLFDVFLCHNSEDKPKVKKIGERLKEEGILPWLDEWELPPGLPWQESVEEQIKEIKSAVVFVGESGIGPWQAMETKALLNQFVNRKCPVIPVMLENAPEEPDLPLFLQEMTWVDFRKDVPDPMKRLIWGITGRKG